MFAGVLLVCFMFSTGMRYQQFETWEKTPAVYFVDERPLMTTLDAPFWLSLARDYNEVTFRGGELLRKDGGKAEHSNTHKSIPSEFLDSSPSTQRTLETNYRDVPLLSFLIAHFSAFFSQNYYLTGTLLIPVLASLFILPLGYYFFIIGVPVSGLMGGLIGTFAGAYYMRSSIGRIDTDMLNLFFPSLAALLILLASRAKTERSVLLYSAATGLILFLFYWWYAKAGFTLTYFVVLVFCLFVQKIRFRTILLSGLLFLLCADPGIFLNGTNNIQTFLKGYISIEESGGSVIENKATPATFPNTMTTISEVDHLQTEAVLRRILDKPIFNWIGIISFFGLAVLRWRVLVPLVPMLALGLLSFQSSNRFIMYLAPFIGIGLGWLLQLGIEGLFVVIGRNGHHRDDREVQEAPKKVKGKRYFVKNERLNLKGSFWSKIISWISMAENEIGTVNKLDEATEAQSYEGAVVKNFNLWNWARQVVLYLMMGLFFWLISGQTAISFVPRPSIHPKVFESFLEVKKRVIEGAKLLTWWDYGHTLNDIGLGTFHDGGGKQFSPLTYFIARSLISSDEKELFDITQFLATEGNSGIIINNTSSEDLLNAIRNHEKKPLNPIYLFFTADMTGKYGAISKLGSWDLVKGGSNPRVYQYLRCNNISNEEMNCLGAKIDLKGGFINNQLPLHRLIFIRNGQVVREQLFRHLKGFTLQLIVSGKNIVEVQLIDEEVFSSNYNQMFFLGRFRKDLFEESYNAFPFSRLFRFKY